MKIFKTIRPSLVLAATLLPAVNLWGENAADGHNQQADKFDRIATLESPSVSHTAKIYGTNPATYGMMYDFSITDVSVTYNTTDRMRGATLPWQGNKAHDVNATVEAYMKINPTLTVWGNASYVTGKQHGVRWNSVVDYTRIAPYVLADSVGGSIDSQQYDFGGGVGLQLGQWNIGADLSYRAEIDYRGRDPRVKDVVSDLVIDLGAARRWNGWTVGLSGKLTIYNQDSDVEFYNPINNIRTYLLTGLGSTYQRFSGGSTSTTAYEGMGYYGALQIGQTGLRGFKLDLRGGKETMKQRVRDYNNLDLTKTDTYLLATDMIYAFPRIASITFDAQWTRRIGRENLFGSSEGNFYPQISSRENYYIDYVTAGATVPVELNLDATTNFKLDLIPGFKYSYLRQFLREPNRLVENYYLTPGMSVRASWQATESCRLTLQAGYDRTMTHNTCNRLKGLPADRDITAVTEHEVSILTASGDIIKSLARCDLQLPKLPDFYIQASCDHSHLMHRQYPGATFTSVTLGAIF